MKLSTRWVNLTWPHPKVTWYTVDMFHKLDLGRQAGLLPYIHARYMP